MCGGGRATPPHTASPEREPGPQSEPPPRREPCRCVCACLAEAGGIGARAIRVAGRAWSRRARACVRASVHASARAFARASVRGHGACAWQGCGWDAVEGGGGGGRAWSRCGRACVRSCVMRVRARERVSACTCVRLARPGRGAGGRRGGPRCTPRRARPGPEPGTAGGILYIYHLGCVIRSRAGISET